MTTSRDAVPPRLPLAGLRHEAVELDESQPEVVLLTEGGRSFRVQARGTWNGYVPTQLHEGAPNVEFPTPMPRGRSPVKEPSFLHPRERRFRPIQELPLTVSDLTVTVSVGRDSKTLVESVSFDVAPGEMVALIGPSGAGKSTLVNAINTMTRFEGTVSYGETALDEENVHLIRNVLGIVPQFDLIASPLPMRRALEFAAQLRMPGVVRSERERQIEQLVEDLGLRLKLDTPLDRLSGGERKRTAVGMELLAGASIIILDEPTTGLDPDAEANLVELLGSLADYGRRTILMITHSKDALAQCDAVIALSKTPRDSGALAYYGPPSTAPEHFGGQPWDYAFMYRRMQAIEEGWPSRFRPPPKRSLAMPRVIPTRSWVTWGRQAAIMARRSMATLLWHGSEMRKFALQSILSVFVMLFILGSNNLTPDREQAKPVLFLAFLAISTLVMPILNATREIVKESDLVARDLTVGMNPASYVLGRFAYIGSVSVLQAWVTAFVLLFQGEAGEGVWQATRLGDALILLALGSLSAAALGLAISSAGRSEPGVMMWVPIVVVLQILTSGAFLDVRDFGLVASILPAYWTFRGLGTAYGLGDLDPTCPLNADCWWAEWEPNRAMLQVPAWWLLAQIAVYVAVALVLVYRTHGRRR